MWDPGCPLLCIHSSNRSSTPSNSSLFSGRNSSTAPSTASSAAWARAPTPAPGQIVPPQSFARAAHHANPCTSLVQSSGSLVLNSVQTCQCFHRPRLRACLLHRSTSTPCFAPQPALTTLRPASTGMCEPLYLTSSFVRVDKQFLPPSCSFPPQLRRRQLCTFSCAVFPGRSPSRAPTRRSQ